MVVPQDKVSFQRTQQELTETCAGKSNLPNRKSLVASEEEFMKYSQVQIVCTVGGKLPETLEVLWAVFWSLFRLFITQ